MRAGMLACCLALAAGTAAAQTPAPDPDAVPVSTARAEHRNVPIFTQGIGTVQAYQSVLVRARVDGTLEKIAFREGQDVKTGDLLAIIDPRPYQAALAQAQAKKAADEAQLQNARLDLARYANLARTNFASRQQLDTQQATVGQDSANLQGDDAAIAAAALNLSFCSIQSPIDGVVGLRMLDMGNLVHASDTTGIVTVTQVQPISLVFTLPGSELVRVQQAMQHGSPKVLAFGSGSSTKLAEGTLLTPNNTIDTTTGTVQLKATFPNTDKRLWPGLFVDAHLQLGTDDNAVTVPPPAIQHGPDGLYVYTVKPDMTTARQEVKVSYEDDTTAVISEGLSGGETVVTDGQMRLQPGTKVTVRHAAGAAKT
jgi:multidrug efflux system membrane fusion protein